MVLGAPKGGMILCLINDLTSSAAALSVAFTTGYTAKCSMQTSRYLFLRAISDIGPTKWIEKSSERLLYGMYLVVKYCLGDFIL